MFTYGPEPKSSCQRHLPWHWQDVKEGSFHVYQKCKGCGQRRILRYSGSPRDAMPEDSSWLLPITVAPVRKARKVLVLTGYGATGSVLQKQLEDKSPASALAI
jgi:hypothetical protein